MVEENKRTPLLDLEFDILKAQREVDVTAIKAKTKALLVLRCIAVPHTEQFSRLHATSHGRRLDQKKLQEPLAVRIVNLGTRPLGHWR